LKINCLSFKWDKRAGPVVTFSKGQKSIHMFLICHRREERCLRIKGHTSFLCSRCTGLCIGIALAIVLTPLLTMVSEILRVLFLIPLLVDGFSQLLTSRTSNNALRLVTGILFPFGLSAVM
jgi:uncharacterized membrane protein